MNHRAEQVCAKLLQDGLDGVIISKGSDVKYLSGFTGEYGCAVLLLTTEKNYLITDTRYEYQAGEETKDYEIHPWRSGSGSMYQELGSILKECGIGRIGIRNAEISYADYLKLQEECGCEFTDCISYAEPLRRVKSEEEIGRIRKACQISDQSFQAVLSMIKPGITEMDIQNALEFEFRKRESEGSCFPTIVASGPNNGANCHATPTRRKIQNGDMITMDFGACYEGYCSDMTRTVALGEPNKKLIEIYGIVKEAKANAASILKAGITLKELDHAARSIIESHGYILPHGLGHSFGFDIHEAPFISPRTDYAMECNVIHTLEPGIYVPGLGGVRIEDDYLIGQDGAEQLTHALDELIIL